jgi:hypothetical protein
MELAEALNRTVKLAMDEGRARSCQEALALFESFRLRVHVAADFTQSPGAEAALLTILVAAPKTFMGGVEVTGLLEVTCTQAWFEGKALREVAAELGCVGNDVPSGIDMPTLCIGAGERAAEDFWLGLNVFQDGFTLTPEAALLCSPAASVEAGVAAAGAALNQAFQRVYRRAPQAGLREVHFRFPSPVPSRASRNQWLVGLGHLGQAYLWTLMLQQPDARPRMIRLTDDDRVSRSSLSTCMLVDERDVGRSKVEAVAQRLKALGVDVQLDPQRLNLDFGLLQSEQPLCVVAVDNFALRRSLDRLQGARVLEAGIGDGTQGYTRVQAHAFPGPRLARDVWVGADPSASKSVDISMPAYQELLKDSGDECGTTLVAGRSVATPFVGAFAGALLARLAVAGELTEHAWGYDLNAL